MRKIPEKLRKPKVKPALRSAPQPKTAVDSGTSVTQSQVKRILIALGALGIAGYAVHSSLDNTQKKEASAQVRDAETDNTLDKDTKVLDLNTSKILPPTFRLAGITADYEPSQFVPKITPERMKQVSVKFAEFLTGYYRSTVIPQLEKAGNNTDATKAVTNGIIKEIENFFQNQDPEISQTWEEAKRTGNTTIKFLFVNNFLMMQKLMLTIQRDKAGQAAFFNLTPIEKFQNGIIEDQQTKQKTVVPIFFLKPALLEQVKIPWQLRQTPIYFDPETGIVFYSTEEQKAVFLRTRPSTEIKKANPQFPDEALMDLNNFNPTLQHEAVHKFLFAKHTNDIKRVNPEARDFVDVSIVLEGGKKIRIKGNYHPAAFHELAANGAEMASITEADLNKEKIFLDSKFSKDAPSTYDLVRLFVEKGFEKPGENPWTTAMKSSTADIQSVGRQMYTAGVFLLENRKKVQ